MSYWGWLNRICSSSVSLYAVTYIATSLWAPGCFLEKMAAFRVTRQLRWWGWPKFALTAIGLGLLLYSPAYVLIAAVPYSWGSSDEDDAWRSDRDYLRFIAGGIGALLIGERLEKNASILVWGPIEQQARGLLQHALRATSSYCPERFAVTRTELVQSLSGTEWEKQTQRTTCRDQIREEIVRYFTDD